MSQQSGEKQEFEVSVSQAFSFLVNEYDFDQPKFRYESGDPRDACFVADFRKGGDRIEIAWSSFQQVLMVSIRRNIEAVTRRKRHLYLEPFIEFYTTGRVKPIVPQVYYGMTVTQLEAVCDASGRLFDQGYSEVMQTLADRLREYMEPIVSLTAETIRSYHTWYANHR